MAVLDLPTVYDNRLDRPRVTQHVLSDLVPEDTEHGWPVARNLDKPLNHLDFLRRKEEIACQLQLHNVHTPTELFEPNYEVLALHQARRVSTERIIRSLATQCQQAESDVVSLLREYATIRHMEFHPTDVCNLRCRGCTYGHDVPALKPPPIQFPFAGIRRIRALQPRSMVVIGGGEPTLYRSGQASFQEMTEEIVQTNPGITLALVTNGTHRPEGNWPDQFSWMRLSLDAATPETYATFRGKPFFERVIKHFLEYLDFRVRRVGISFLFGRTNVKDYASVARFIHDLVRDTKPQHLHKVNIQYRPLRRDPYRYRGAFVEEVTPEQIQQAVREVRTLADSSPEMLRFLREQTNVTAILGGNGHPAHAFARCYYSQAFHIVRANGDLRPCFIRVNEPDFVLGNLHTDSLESIALNTLYIGARRKPHCDEHGCRQCHVNYTFEQGLLGNKNPSTAPEVLADPMF